MQRRGGLVISEADGLFDDVYDKLGDKFSNNGEYNRRHHGVLYKTRDAMAAVAVGSIVQGDKAEPEKVSYINEGKTVDIAEVGGDEVTGGDVCVDTKVPSPLTKTRTAGLGSVQNGGNPASVGHIYAFGNTEELLRIKVLGCRRRGRRRQGPFNHSTGKGWVKEVKGDYADALSKGSRVIPGVVETMGGVVPHLRAYLRYLARRARHAGGLDGTVYGSSRTSASSFYSHHIQRIGLAAQLGDARGIRRAIRERKQSLYATSIRPRGSPA